MTAVSITGPGEGELIVNGPTSVRILEDGSSTGHRLGMGEITIPPHTPGPNTRRELTARGQYHRRDRSSCWRRHSSCDQGLVSMGSGELGVVLPQDQGAGTGLWLERRNG